MSRKPIAMFSYLSVLKYKASPRISSFLTCVIIVVATGEMVLSRPTFAFFFLSLSSTRGGLKRSQQ